MHCVFLLFSFQNVEFVDFHIFNDIVFQTSVSSQGLQGRTSAGGVAPTLLRVSFVNKEHHV